MDMFFLRVFWRREMGEEEEKVEVGRDAVVADIVDEGGGQDVNIILCLFLFFFFFFDWPSDSRQQ
jgi:hypothetical protein